MLSVNVLLQPHVFNSSFYFLSLVRAKKKGKKFIPIFIQKLRVRVMCESVLYSNKYGICRDKFRSGRNLVLLLLGAWCSIHISGMRVVCEWRHKCRTFRPPWSTLPGPGRQPLGGSISLKFLLETRLQSESFDTLDDLLGFQVQKLWCKLVKIFAKLDI